MTSCNVSIHSGVYKHLQFITVLNMVHVKNIHMGEAKSKPHPILWPGISSTTTPTLSREIMFSDVSSLHFTNKQNPANSTD